MWGMLGYIAGVFLVFCLMPKTGYCKMGLHRWNMPGGHCEDCGACDEFFGGHEACRKHLKA
jgi:hypothetical protein